MTDNPGCRPPVVAVPIAFEHGPSGSNGPSGPRVKQERPADVMWRTADRLPAGHRLLLLLGWLSSGRALLSSGPDRTLWTCRTLWSRCALWAGVTLLTFRTGRPLGAGIALISLGPDRSLRARVSLIALGTCWPLWTGSALLPLIALRTLRASVSLWTLQPLLTWLPLLASRTRSSGRSDYALRTSSSDWTD